MGRVHGIWEGYLEGYFFEPDRIYLCGWIRFFKSLPHGFLVVLDFLNSEASSWLQVSQNSMAPLGSFWDCDFMSMEVAPSALACFATFWEVGGSLQRPPQSYFPLGLESRDCSQARPYTLRLRSILHDETNETHEDLLVEAGEGIRAALTRTGPTGHPILATHRGREQQVLDLAGNERCCSAKQVGMALEQALNGLPYSPSIADTEFTTDVSLPMMRRAAEEYERAYQL